MAINETKTVTINTANKIALVVFDGTRGQQVTLNISSVTIPTSFVSVYRPDGTSLVSPTFVGTGGGTIGLQILPATGTYSILVDNSVITTVVGNGIKGYGGDGGPASSAMLNFPTAVAKDEQGNLLIADSTNYRIRKVDTSGVISTVATAS